VNRPQRGRQERPVDRREPSLRLVETPDQKQSPHGEMSRMRTVDAIAVLLERRTRDLERLRRPAEIPRDQRDLGFGDDAPRASHNLARTERARGTAQQGLGPHEIAQLRHRDSPQRQRGGIVAQGDTVQCAQRITCGKGASRGPDQRIHRNPDTFVTHIPRIPGAKFISRRPNGEPLPELQPVTNDIGTHEREAMTTHKTGTREEWLAARLALLEAEKELTRRSDDLAQRRQDLPWVRVDKTYRFDTDQGSASLADLFGGRSELLVYHFMFGPNYKAGCPSCSAIADGFNGFAVHLAHHDVTLAAISRAPLAKLQAYKQRMGWTFPWASSFGGDFNFDFNVSQTEQQQRDGGVEYNYRLEPAWQPRPDGGGATAFATMSGTDVATYIRERPGMSAFVLEDGAVYHTYSTFARGLDGLWGMYQWLDRAPRGRNESGLWWRRHDEYDER